MSEDLFLPLQTVWTLMKCSIMLHFIWVFTVCKTYSGVSRIHRVNVSNFRILSTAVYVFHTLSSWNENTVKHVYNSHSQKDWKLVFKTNYRLIQVKSIAECSAILSTFIRLLFAIKIFVLSIFEWLFYTGFTVDMIQLQTNKILTLS